MTLCYVLLLGFAVSIDGFIAGISYGLKILLYLRFLYSL